MDTTQWHRLTLELISNEEAQDELRRLAGQAHMDRAMLKRLAQYATAAPTPRSNQRKPLDESRLLLTPTAFCRAVGIDRRTTFARLIHDGDITTVPGPRGPRIPRHELERLLRDGVHKPANGPRRRRRTSRRAVPPPNVGDEIDSIKID